VGECSALMVGQGQRGRSFYVCDSGEFKVSMRAEGIAGVEVLNTLSRGHCFGESALMTSSMTRTATVGTHG
jgi:CRP-like cAMP-binding protein